MNFITLKEWLEIFHTEHISINEFISKLKVKK